MAKSCTRAVLALFAALLLSAVAGASPDARFYKSISPRNLGMKREKLSHLHFFFHDIPSGKNPTAVRVAAAPSTISSPTSFGFVAMMDDPLTVGPERGSRKVGAAQGIYAGASQTESALLMVYNFAFTEGKFNGSTLSVLGRNSVLSAVREMPIVGGSGVFRFAGGYALAKTHFFNFSNGDTVVEYNVYVLHY